MVKKVLFSLTILFGILAVYFYNQPESRYMFEASLRSIKLERNVKSLSANSTCADESTKRECFLHFFRANGPIQFSVDLGLYMVSIFNICNKKTKCVHELSDQLFQSIDLNKLWIRQSKFVQSSFGVEAMKVEFKYVDNILRNFRKKLTTDFDIEQEPAQKKMILVYIKNVDEKLIQIANRAVN